MPPKKRPNGQLPIVKKKKSFCKTNFREAEVQTDAELGALLESVSALNASESASNDRDKFSSSMLLRRQNILMMQLSKITNENREMKAVIAKYQQIPNLFQAIKVHYESTFNSIRDDMAMLVLEQRNRETKLLDHLRKQKSAIERLIATKDEKLEAKKEKNKALKDEKKLLNEHLGLLQEALELEQRRVQVAVKEQCNAIDEAQEIRQKMHDKLFLAANQRCSTCQTRERVQDDLTGQIADKLHQIEELHNLLRMKEDSIVEKDRINQILISEVEKKRGELKDKEFATNSYQSELAKQQRELRQAKMEIQQLKVMAQKGNNGTNNAQSQQRQPNPHTLTPPEDEYGPAFGSLPSSNVSHHRQFFKHSAPISTGKAISNSKIGGEKTATGESQNAKTRRKLSEEEQSMPAFVDKRPRVGPPTNDGICSIGLENGNGTARDGQKLAHGATNKRKLNADEGPTMTGGEGANGIRRGETATERFFRSPPPLNRKGSNAALLAPPQLPPQQPKNRSAQPTPFEGPAGPKQQPQANGPPKNWHPTAEKQCQTQKPQQPLTTTQIQQQPQQQQTNRNHPPLPSGPTTSTKLTTPSSHQSFFFSSNINNNNNSSFGPSFRKSAGATIDDFCVGPPKATTYDIINNNNNIRGRTPSPAGGGGGKTIETWRKTVSDNFFPNRPAETHAALPPVYACQQQNFPPPRPSAPIPRPPTRTIVQQQNFNNCIHAAPRIPTGQQKNGGGGGTLPWHSQSSGTFPCTTSQQSQHHPTTQFFIR